MSVRLPDTQGDVKPTVLMPSFDGVDDVIARFAPIYVLFPAGDNADHGPFDTRRCDYHPIPVEEFLARAIAVPRHPADTRWFRRVARFAPAGSAGLALTKLPERLTMGLLHFGIAISPVLVSLLFGLVLAALDVALFGIHDVADVALVLVFAFGFVALHAVVHLPSWPRGDKLKTLAGDPGSADFLLTLPHPVWPRDVWRRYGRGALSSRPTIYGRRRPWGASGEIVQYWAYYLHNDWANRHESDWEVVTVMSKDGREPTSAVYSVHERAFSRTWHDTSRFDDEGKLDADGTHPLVYVAVGSHAQYFGSRHDGYPTLITRRLPTGNQATVWSAPNDLRHRDFVVDLTPEEITVTGTYRIVELPGDSEFPSGTALASDLWWLRFAGPWGREGGPNGPAYQGLKWSDPLAWAEASADPSRDPYVSSPRESTL